MNSNRVLIFTLEYPPQVGGIARYAAGLAQLLEREYTVVLADGSRREAIQHTMNLHIIRKPFFFRFLRPRWFRSIPTVLSVIQEHRIECIITTHALPLGTICLLFYKLFSIPYIISLHGYDVLCAQESWRKKWLIKNVLRSARGIIVNSAFTKHETEKLIEKRVPIFVLPPCPTIRSTTGDFPSVPQRRAFTKPIVLSVGRLVERKGFDLVIGIIPKLLEFFPILTYVVVGYGPALNTLERMATKLNIRERVLFLGQATDDELDHLYKAADVFVMPSRQIGSDVEGFGLVFLEANLRKLPVIGTRSGGIPDAVEEGVSGLLVPPDNPNALYEALFSLLKNPKEAFRMGDEGRARVLLQFTWENMRPRFFSWLLSL